MMGFKKTQKMTSFVNWSWRQVFLLLTATYSRAVELAIVPFFQIYLKNQESGYTYIIETNFKSLKTHDVTDSISNVKGRNV